jgi:hypothetical protein
MLTLLKMMLVISLAYISTFDVERNKTELELDLIEKGVNTSNLYLYQAEPENIPYFISSWYDKVADLTAETHFIDITYGDALSIIAYHRHVYIKSSNMSKIHVQILREIEQEIDETFRKFFPQDKVFAKFEMQSFKDSWYYNPVDIFPYAEKEYQRLKAQYNYKNWKDIATPEQYDLNLKTMSFVLTEFMNMASKSAKDIMMLILTSTRTFKDLAVYTHYHQVYKDRGHQWNFKLALRKYIDDISLTREFRCYIVNNKMTAISKHENSIQEEQLTDEFDIYVKKIVWNYWNDIIKERLVYLNDYVVDIALRTNDVPFLVEINPLRESATFAFQPTKNLTDRSIIYNDTITEEEYSIDRCVFRIKKKFTDTDVEEMKKYMDDIKDFEKEHPRYDTVLAEILPEGEIYTEDDEEQEQEQEEL